MKITTVKKITAIILLVTTGFAGAYDFTGHSFFSVRTPFQSASPEKEALWHYDWISACREGVAGTVEAVPFGGRTFGDELGHYFGPHGKTHLWVREFDPNDTTTNQDLETKRDLEARHFNIETIGHKFESKIRLTPVQSIFGIGLAYRQRFTKRVWFEIATPIMGVRNTIEFSETDVAKSGGTTGTPGLDGKPHVGTMTEALTAQNWKYGRMVPNESHTKWGVADVEVKLGWETYTSKQAHMRSFIGIVIPTGNKPDPTYLFSPVVGNNQHFGGFFGSNLGFELYASGDHLIHQEIDTMGRYLFANDQMRSFDLKDKEWSRYMEMYENKAAATAAENNASGTSGINLMAYNVKVSPRFATTFNTAFLYTYREKFIAEFGYNLMARQGEKIEFDDDHKFTSTASLKHVNGTGLTTRSRTIKDNFEGDQITLADYTPIKESDLEMESAAHPPMIAQIIYGSIGYKCDAYHHPTSFSVGGSYEFSHSNGGIQRWLMWAKACIAF